MPKQPSHRAYVSDVTIALGPMEVVGDLIPPKESGSAKAEAFVSVCPVCNEPHKAKQSYICTEDETHGPFTIGELDKAKDDGGELIRVTAQEVKGAKESELPEKQLELAVHRLHDVETSVLESGTSYVFRPKGSSKFYGILLDLLAKRDDFVLMGRVSLRGIDKLVRIERGLNNQLILCELVWPEDLKAFEAPEYEYKPSLLETAEKLLEGSVTDFEPDDYKREARERIAELIAAKREGREVPAATKKDKTVSDDDNLEALLELALAEATG